MIADDEPLILDTLKHYLESRGIEVSVASDGQKAVELLQQESFDVVLSDIRMPKMDGLALYDAALEISPKFAHNFVFMSGDLVRESTRNFVKSSGRVCLEKPFSFEVMYDAIALYLRNSEAEEVKTPDPTSL